MSTTTKLTQVMPIFGGAYDVATTYKKLTIITYNGDSFITLIDDVVGITPTDDGINYQLLAAHGADGAGAVNSVNTQTGAVVLNGSHIVLTGYSIAGAAAAVAATDTVNQAIGKLQKTIDGVETLLAAL